MVAPETGGPMLATQPAVLPSILKTRSLAAHTLRKQELLPRPRVAEMATMLNQELVGMCVAPRLGLQLLLWRRGHRLVAQQHCRQLTRWNSRHVCARTAGLVAGALQGSSLPC